MTTKHYFRYIALMVLCVASLQSWAQTAQRDTVFFYKTWRQMLYQTPEALIQNPMVDMFSPYEYDIYSSIDDVDKRIANDFVAATLGDSIWLVNTNYLKQYFKGDAKKLRGYVPIYFNEKVAFITYGYEREWSVSVTDYLFGQKDFDGSTEVYPSLYYIDFINRKVRKVDHMVLSELLEDYHDLQVRFEGMKDYKKPYIITDFFFQFIDRATEDFMRPNILDLIN
ncbi:MAG: hypothetical protein II040_03610 [Muribaculaceae bacterium]|nr:hypothetical protein [Muribaculaceae bacterium]